MCICLCFGQQGPEEFNSFADWDKEEEEKEALQQWEDDWDDDDVNDDFSLQLRKELEKKSDEQVIMILQSLKQEAQTICFIMETSTTISYM